ncbi:hypothetical protein R1sor_019434 [Riccia sorocarpa]|uniref:Reverse transcriptase n=1 Tax=Riccia sorocarpa TaxID=122646 RepID=A0ABD3IGS5_9MARC
MEKGPGRTVCDTEEENEALARAEKKLKDRELLDARAWRVRSRERWLTEDEAPSKYFFAKLRSKWARESIRELDLSLGEVSADGDEILEEIHSYYQKLYTAEEESPEREGAQEEVIGLIQKGLLAEEVSRVSSIPGEQEIKEVIFGMKTNKAPGLDGLTIEVLQACWEFVGGDCIKMLLIMKKTCLSYLSHTVFC